MSTHLWRKKPESKQQISKTVKLPEPDLTGSMSVEQAIKQRRSIRSYSNEPLTLKELGQILWAAQGITRPDGYRSAPSAGALDPLEVYVLAGSVESLKNGFYRYAPETHTVIGLLGSDLRGELSQAALGQEFIQEAPAVIVLSAIFERTMVKYSERGFQYVHAEVGSAAQNIYLQVTSLGLGTAYVGAFYDKPVSNVLGLRKEETPLCIMPVGHPNE